jgi:hypothetical protein
MNTATAPTHVVERAAGHGAEPSSQKHTDVRPSPPDTGWVPLEDVASLVVRIAARVDCRVGETRRVSAACGRADVAELHGRLLAAVSMSSGEALAEPTPSGAATAAVVRYRVARLERRRSAPRIARA